MKIKAGKLWEAMPILTRIINEKRPMPQAGKFRIARMHAKLHPEFVTINEQRDELIKVYDHHPQVFKDPELAQAVALGIPIAIPADAEKVDSSEFSVPDDKLVEFNEKWGAVANEDIDINVMPIPIEMLSPVAAENGSIEALEIALLGDLLTDMETASAPEVIH